MNCLVHKQSPYIEDPVNKAHLYIMNFLFSTLLFVLVCSVLVLLQNTIDWVAYKEQKFISHCSGGWEVHDPGTNRFILVWWVPAHWFIEAIFTVSSI